MLIQHSCCLIKPVINQDQEALLTVYHQCEDFLALGPEPQASPERILADLVHSREQGKEILPRFDYSTKNL
jgi:hypothetical protein